MPNQNTKYKTSQSYWKSDTARVGIALLISGSLFICELIWFINNGNSLPPTIGILIIIQMVITSMMLGPLCGAIFGGKTNEELEKESEVIPQINPNEFDYSKLGAEK